MPSNWLFQFSSSGRPSDILHRASSSFGKLITIGTYADVSSRRLLRYDCNGVIQPRILPSVSSKNEPGIGTEDSPDVLKLRRRDVLQISGGAALVALSPAINGIAAAQGTHFSLQMCELSLSINGAPRKLTVDSRTSCLIF
jgi:hypothetical protein